jgi:serine/threonine-protein kinase
MSSPVSDHNLLLGIVALQMDFITRDVLIEAMHIWTLEKTRPLSEILVETGGLDPADCSVLERLVERHVARHGGDPQQSLSALDVTAPDRKAFEPLPDPDIQASLSHLAQVSTLPDSAPEPAAATSTWTEAEAAGGRFRILRLHDQGGLGNVFVALDRELEREVALKQLKDEFASDSQSRARFVLEAEITGNLEHPGVVPVYGKGNTDLGRPYYAMRFVRGDDLKASTDRFHHEPGSGGDTAARQREFQKLMRRFLAVCETVAYAHDRGVIHRDLKPRNILLGPYGETLIVDWGLAKVVGRGDLEAPVEPAEGVLRPTSGSGLQPTMAGQRLGTPAYMSPEQARGEVDRVGPASDVYSLGATLYYLLVGKPAFRDDDVSETLRKVERGLFPPPRQAKPGADRSLEAICLRAMALRPEARYASPRALADDIERWLADQPVSAYREPFSARAYRFLRRRKQWVAAAGALLVAALIGLTVHDWLIARERSRTGDQLVMTREALRRLLEVAGQRLATYTGTAPLRSELTAIVSEKLDKLVETYPNDLDLRVEAVRVHGTQAGIARITGQFQESLLAHEQTLRALDHISRDPARRTAERTVRAKILLSRGSLYLMSGKSGPALRDFEAVLRVLEGSQAYLDAETFRDLKASALLDRSEVWTLQGRPAYALTDADEAARLLDARQDNWDTAGMSDESRIHLSMALADRGLAQRALEENSKAEADLKVALQVARDVPSSSDYFVDAQSQAAFIQSALGELLSRDPARLALAQHHLDESVQLLDPLCKKFAEYTAYRRDLGATLITRSQLHFALANPSGALKDVLDAQTMLQELLKAQPQNADYLSLLAQCAEVLAQIRDAQGEKQKAVELRLEMKALLEKTLALDAERAGDRKRLEAMAAQSRSAPGSRLPP